MKNYIIGIDPGMTGCLSVFRYDDNSFKVIKVAEGFVIDMKKKAKCKKGKNKGKVMIYANNYPDVDKMVYIVKRIKEQVGIQFAIIEKQQPMRKLGIVQGVVSVGKTMMGYGMWLGVLKMAEIPTMIVHSKTWQKSLFQNVPGFDTKEKSRYVASKLFPNLDFHRKVDHNKSDSCLLAYYCYKVKDGV